MKVVTVRLPEAVLQDLPSGRGERSDFIRRAIRFYADSRDGTNPFPIPREAELSALQYLIRELNRIGVNLNQATLMLHLLEQDALGRDKPPTPEEMTDLHKQLSSFGRRLEAVVRYWRVK